MRIPLKSAGDSGANRPLIPLQSGRGRSEATLEFFHSLTVDSVASLFLFLSFSDRLSFQFNLVAVVQ